MRATLVALLTFIASLALPALASRDAAAAEPREPERVVAPGDRDFPTIGRDDGSLTFPVTTTVSAFELDASTSLPDDARHLVVLDAADRARLWSTSITTTRDADGRANLTNSYTFFAGREYLVVLRAEVGPGDDDNLADLPAGSWRLRVRATPRRAIRGPEVRFHQPTTITNVEQQARLPVGATVYACVWDDATGGVVATGANVRGTGVNAWLGSPLAFTFEPDHVYRIGFVSLDDVGARPPARPTRTAYRLVLRPASTP